MCVSAESAEWDEANMIFHQVHKKAHIVCDPLTNMEGMFGMCLAFFDGQTLHDSCIDSMCDCRSVSLFSFSLFLPFLTF